MPYLVPGLVLPHPPAGHRAAAKQLGSAWGLGTSLEPAWAPAWEFGRKRWDRRSTPYLDEFWGECLPDSREGTAGSIFCKPWFAIDSLIREVNGGYIGSGLNKARWEICWRKIIRW